jgi:hypothetical protein
MPHQHPEWTGDRGFADPQLFADPRSSPTPPPAEKLAAARTEAKQVLDPPAKKRQSADEAPSTPAENADEKQGSEALE